MTPSMSMRNAWKDANRVSKKHLDSPLSCQICPMVVLVEQYGATAILKLGFEVYISCTVEKSQKLGVHLWGFMYKCLILSKVCRGVWNPPFLFLFHLYIKPHFLQKQTYPPFCRSCFSKINMIQIYTTPLNTTIFLTSKSYGGIKLVWIWRIST